MLNSVSLSDDLHFVNKISTSKYFVPYKIDVDLRHTRLGHPNSKMVVKFLKYMNNTFASHDAVSFCHAYKLGKLSQTSFPQSSSKTNIPL